MDGADSRERRNTARARSWPSAGVVVNSTSADSGGSGKHLMLLVGGAAGARRAARRDHGSELRAVDSEVVDRRRFTVVSDRGGSWDRRAWETHDYMEAHVRACGREGTQVLNRLVWQRQREPNWWKRRGVFVPLIRVVAVAGVPVSVEGEVVTSAGRGSRCAERSARALIVDIRRDTRCALSCCEAGAGGEQRHQHDDSQDSLHGTHGATAGH